MTIQIMPTLGKSVAVPAVGKESKLGERFSYWYGMSGRRYLFTSVPIDSLDDFGSAVVLIARKGEGHAWEKLWVGDIADTKCSCGRWLRRMGRSFNEAFVHLLAGDSGEREQVIADLNIAA